MDHISLGADFSIWKTETFKDQLLQKLICKPKKDWYLLRRYQVDSFYNLDFWVKGTNTLPTPNMTVNKLERCEHILFKAYDYNIFAPLSPKIYKINKYL